MMAVPEGKKSDKRAEITFEKIMIQNFSNFMKKKLNI